MRLPFSFFFFRAGHRFDPPIPTIETQPGPPLGSGNSDDVGGVVARRPAPFLDGDQAEGSSFAERVLDRRPADAGDGRDLLVGQGALSALPHFIGDHRKDSLFAVGEAGDESRRQPGARHPLASALQALGGTWPRANPAARGRRRRKMSGRLQRCLDLLHLLPGYLTGVELAVEALPYGGYF